MGQSHPIFAAPDCHALNRHASRPVDLVHLARQTGGDKSLEEEVLQLFSRQANMLARDLRGERNTEARRRLAHTLNGAARAVGAMPLAELAADVERTPDADAKIGPLAAKVDETCDFISALLR